MKKLMASLLLLCIAFGAWAFPPVVVIGVDGAAGLGSSDPSGLYTLGASATMDYRTIFGESSYFGTWLDLSLAWDLAALPLASDSEGIGFVVGTSVEAVEIEAGAGMTASTGYLGGSPGGTAEWHALVQLPFVDHRAAAGLAYSGHFSYAPDSPTDRTSHSGKVFVEHSPSLQLGYLVAVDGEVELYAEAPILDGAGSPTSVNRSDYLFGLTSELEGLSGYFTSWDIRAEGGVRLSNANRYIDFTAAVEPDSEARVYGRLTGGIQSSPAREWGLNGAFSIDGAAYLARGALVDGVPSGETASFLTSSISASTVWSPSAHLYLTLAGDGSISLSNDSDFRGWSLQLSAAVDYRF